MNRPFNSTPAGRGKGEDAQLARDLEQTITGEPQIELTELSRHARSIADSLPGLTEVASRAEGEGS
jgi:hypothetical protein